MTVTKIVGDQFEVSMHKITVDAEKDMAYIARVSSPNQENPSVAGLLKFCIKKRHWSVFEHAIMTIEIITSRAITQQIIRHRSFSFSEFSQRYASLGDSDFMVYEARSQAKKNRQSSIDDMDDDTKAWWKENQMQTFSELHRLYEIALEKGVAKECARMILPMATRSRIYMTGYIRNWIHYIQLRIKEDVQQEHRDIARAIQTVFIGQLPILSEALDWELDTEEYNLPDQRTRDID